MKPPWWRPFARRAWARLPKDEPDAPAIESGPKLSISARRKRRRDREDASAMRDLCLDVDLRNGFALYSLDHNLRQLRDPEDAS